MKQTARTFGWSATIWLVALMTTVSGQIRGPPGEDGLPGEIGLSPLQKGCWSAWLDRDDPSGTGDWETLRSFIKEKALICLRPTGIRCRTKYTKKYSRYTGELVTCSKTTGFLCENRRQRDKKCFDYEVSFLCPCQDRCSSLVKPRYGDVKISRYPSLIAGIVKAKATFSCLPGYTLKGQAQTSCRLNRKFNSYYFAWDPIRRVSCQPPVCPFPYPLDPEDGQVKVTNVRGYWKASYDCDDGFSLVGNKERTCRWYSLWSGRQPKCYLRALVRMNSLPECSFSDNFGEARKSCLFFNSAKNNIEWNQEIYRNGAVLPLRIPKARLPGDCSAVSTGMNGPSGGPSSTAGTFKLVIKVFPFRVYEIKEATIVVGSFIHSKKGGKAAYIRFRLATQTALKYAVQAHATCLPKGHIDSIGSTNDEFKYMTLVTVKPPIGDYCFNLKDTIDHVTCGKFAIQMTLSVQYFKERPTLGRPPNSIQLRATPMGTGSREHCRGASILNEV